METKDYSKIKIDPIPEDAVYTMVFVNKNSEILKTANGKPIRAIHYGAKTWYLGYPDELDKFILDKAKLR